MGECCCGESKKNDHEELEELLSVTSLSIRIFTWNVSAHQPNNTSLTKLLQQKRNPSDIIVIGLQEIVDINSAKSMLFDDDTDNKWNNLILKTLNSSKKNKYKKTKSKKQLIKYNKLKSIRLMGILLLIYSKQTISDDIRNVLSNSVGAGLFGIGPNKGAVGIRFEINNTCICFICAHLAAHKPNIQDRNDNYHKIMSKLTFAKEFEDSNDIKSNDENISIDSHDLVFFFGDLNYRIDYDELDTVYKLIKKKEWNKLLMKDQLLIQMKQQKAFDGFNEHNIEFKPTYKFEIGGSKYDKVKGRMPSYCDRILWKMNVTNRNTQNKKINCLKYNSFDDECMSDHKCVVGLFDLKFQMYL
eukprot:93547_1